MTVSRETPASERRLSMRVDPELKTILQGATLHLQRRGLRTSAGDVVIARLTRRLRDLPLDELEKNLVIQMRQEQAR
jgi:hypothetical protein